MKDLFSAGGELSFAIPSEEIIVDRSRLIGSGSTSRVYKGEYREGKLARHVIAVKELVAPLTRKSHRNLDHEAKMLIKLTHPNVLRFFGRVEDCSSLVSEYLGKVIINVDGESKEINTVRQLLDEKEEDILWVVRLHIAFEAAKGLCYLHKSGCIHCDFKSSNIFTGGEGDELLIKIGDFGESLTEAKEFVTTQASMQDPSRHIAGTIPFVAPEILNGEKPTSMSDIYSFGMFLIELLRPDRSNPWANECRPILVQSKVLANERPTLPSQCDSLPPKALKNVTDMIKKCWAENATDRPSAADIVCEIEKIRNNLSPSEHTEVEKLEYSVVGDVNFRFPDDTN